jgi:hypothetical protein
MLNFHLVRLARLLTLAVLTVGLLACNGSPSDPSGPPPPPEQPEPPEPPDPPEPGTGKRILFIGNSLTYSNDLPGMVKALAHVVGEDLVVESVTFGGVSLEDHWAEGTARRRLNEADWDIVVMQQGPSGAPESRVHLIEWVGRFDEPIRRAGARPAVYMVWPDMTRQTAYDSVASNYTAAAESIDAMLFPGIRVWEAVWARDPTIALYGSDGFHPGPLGTYVVALCMVGQITGKPIIGMPASFNIGAENFTIAPGIARLVQEAAAAAVRDFGRP